MLSIIIPAYNEEKLLPGTLDAVRSALENIAEAEIIVVDNESTDRTREISETFGARIVDESIHNISGVRNAGAKAAKGDVLVFVDSDTVVPKQTLELIVDQMNDARCVGGAVAVEYEPPQHRMTHAYLRMCVMIGRILRMRQGALQFCRADAFRKLDGYDETIFVGEDIEFQWRLARLARKSAGYISFITEPPVRTSSRRFDRFGLFRTLIFSHPVFVFLLWRTRSVWKDWYENAIR